MNDYVIFAIFADTVAYFEGRKAEIEARKEAKRKDAASTKDKLEATLVDLTIPAAGKFRRQF